MLLTEVMIIDNSINNKKIFTAEKGLIKKKYLELYNINEIDINKNNNKEYKTKNIKINFNQQDILNSVKYYKYIPFYNYYNYSKSMKKLNYLTPDIILYFLSELFKPFLLISISFVVTGYVSKFKRNESFFKTIFIAIIIGFILFLINKLIYSININSWLYYPIVILTIPSISIILGTILILRVEKS